VTFGPKVVGTLGHANIMGGYLALIYPLGLAIIKVVKETEWKILTCVGLIVIAVALILTKSRGAWLALSTSLIIFNFRSIKTKWQLIFKNQIVSRTAMLFLVASVFGIIYWLYNINPDSATGRLFVWRIAWNMFASHPVFGIGFQRYPVEYLNYQADFFDNAKSPALFSHAANMKQADNEYFQILAENGIVGLLYIIPFLIILYHLWFLWQKNNDSKSDEYILTKALGISMTAIFLHSFVDNPLRNIAIQIIFLFFIGMISQGIKITGNPTTMIISFRKWILLRIAAVVFLGFTIFDVFLKGSAYINWQQGQAYFKAGYYEKSIEKYCQAQRKLPDNGELLFHLGSAYAYSNQPEQALPFLRRSKSTFNDKNIYIAEGLCYYRLKDYKRAKQSLFTALRMYPNLLLPRLWLAEIYLHTGRNAEALNKLREIIEIQPKEFSREVTVIKRDAEMLLNRVLENKSTR
jgi:tetratricopeptide (TPR) repeat protein